MKRLFGEKMAEIEQREKNMAFLRKRIDDAIRTGQAQVLSVNKLFDAGDHIVVDIMPDASLRVCLMSKASYSQWDEQELDVNEYAMSAIYDPAEPIEW